MTDIAASCARTPRRILPTNRTRIAACLATAVTLFACACRQESTAGETGRADVPAASGFDFFVLALSWSPSYCDNARRPDPAQCNLEPPGFVVHGLWPQYERGYPSNCPTDLPRAVPRSLSDTMLDIMPSTGLIRHEWATHGTCSGVSQQDYFTLTRMAFERVAVPGPYQASTALRPVDPDTVEAAFIAANPGLGADSVAVTCDRRYLRDVRICLARDLSGFVACPEVDADGCARDAAVMPGVR